LGEKLETATLGSSIYKKKFSNVSSVPSVSGKSLLKLNYDFFSKMMCLKQGGADIVWAGLINEVKSMPLAEKLCLKACTSQQLGRNKAPKKITY